MTSEHFDAPVTAELEAPAEAQGVTFADLGLPEELLRAVTALGFTTPSSIQERAIPELLAGRDITGIAQTGTGKTAAFGLPMLAALDTWTLGWLLAGGLSYTLGTFFYHRESIRYSHAIWHLFVLGGSTCHYIAVMAQVVPAR